MKTLLLTIALSLGFSAFADEIPVPAKVNMFNNPTLNGLPFAAIFAHDYQTNAEVGGVNIPQMASNSARFICMFLGYDRVYTYSLAPVTAAKTTVLFIDQNLVATPVETTKIDGYNKGEYATSVFSQLGCYRSVVTRPY